MLKPIINREMIINKWEYSIRGPELKPKELLVGGFQRY
jgi:hypothetical protein